MTLLYKFTDLDKTTRHDTLWGEEVTNKLPFCDNPELCSKDVFHAYTDIDLACLLYSVHKHYNNAILWEANGEIVVTNNLNVGCFKLTTVKSIELPLWVTHELISGLVRLKFTILCAEKVLPMSKDKAPRRAVIIAEKMYKMLCKGNTSDAVNAYFTILSKSAAIAEWDNYDTVLNCYSYDITYHVANAAMGVAHTALNLWHVETPVKVAEDAASADKNINLAAIARKAVEIVTHDVFVWIRNKNSAK